MHRRCGRGLRATTLVALGAVLVLEVSVSSQARVRTQRYDFQAAGITSEYLVFVSTRYEEGTPAPLVVALHPFGVPPQGIMLSQGLLDLADERGYVVVAPRGYDLRTWFPAPGAEGSAARGGQLSEQDVLNVIEEVREAHTIDPRRIYLLGHSMGGGGVWYFGASYPDLWAALAVVAPAPRTGPSTLERLQGIPVIAVHGTADRVVPVARTREWVARMEALGMRHEYVEVPGGDHTGIMARAPDVVGRIFDFFDSAARP